MVLINHWLLPGLLATAVLIATWVITQALEPAVFDSFMRWSARPASQSPVTLVLIDEESIRRLSPRFGPLPWRREAYLEVFRAVSRKKPAVMVFDSHFMSSDPVSDQAFFDRMKAFTNLVTGFVDAPAGRLNTKAPAYYHLNLGVVNVLEEPDGIIRRYKTFFNTGQGVFPSLSLSAVYDYLQRTRTDQRWLMDVGGNPGNSDRHLALFPEGRPKRGLSVPLDQDHAFYLRWRKISGASAEGYQYSHSAIPLWHFFDPKQSRTLDLNGRIALIGSSAVLYRDYHKTPVSIRHLGADIHATAIDNLLSEEGVIEPEPWQNRLILPLLFGLVFMLWYRSRQAGQAVLYTAGFIVIFVWFAYAVLFNQAGIRIDVVTPVAFMIVAALAANGVRVLQGDRQLALMEYNLSKLVAPSVLTEIQRHGRVREGGQRLDITTMFVDIRGFTPIAEGLSPTEVTELLDRFYADVSATVFRHRGMIDKFLGDGILILFGAPIADDRHAALALDCAHDLLAVTEKLARYWKWEQDIDTAIGITVSSGPAYVGFLGTADRLEYTAIGDTVNLCVKLQEKTKTHGHRLIISEMTAHALSADRQKDLDLIDTVTVGNREAPLKIYTLANQNNAEDADHA